jgi:cysteine-rich repeat protein
MYPENALLSFCGDAVLDAGEQCDDGNAVSGDGCSASCGLEGSAGLNRYLCYLTRAQKGSLVAFQIARGVTLADRVETLSVDVRRTETLCNPADVDGSGIGDPAAHLRTYTIAPVPRSPRFQRRMGIGVVTELGDLTVDLLARDDLLVPTAKSLTGPVSPPAANARDRYKCYTVKAVGRPVLPDALVSDQFGQPKTYDVLRPTRLCVPTSKDGDDIENPQAELMCFAVRPARGEPRHVPVTSIYTTDEFWSERLQSVRETELCVPAETTGLP